jgi:diamine N-acetyltransferase
MLTFKNASFCDIHEIGLLAEKIWKVAYSEILSEAQIKYMLNLMYAPQIIEKELHEGVNWEIVLSEGFPIGFIATTVEGTVLKLNKLYLDVSLHGKGYGQQALAHVLKLAGDNGFISVYLTVNKFNTKAIKAYEKFGFKRTDSKVFDIGNGYVMDDFIYTYFL